MRCSRAVQHSNQTAVQTGSAAASWSSPRPQTVKMGQRQAPLNCSSRNPPDQQSDAAAPTGIAGVPASVAAAPSDSRSCGHSHPKQKQQQSPVAAASAGGVPRPPTAPHRRPGLRPTSGGDHRPQAHRLQPRRDMGSDEDSSEESKKQVRLGEGQCNAKPNGNQRDQREMGWGQIQQLCCLLGETTRRQSKQLQIWCIGPEDRASIRLD